MGAAGAGNTTTDIRVDQVGYSTEFPKIAFVVDRPGLSDPADFFVRRAKDGSPALHGVLKSATVDVDSGDRIRAADFSALNESGSFFLDVPGVGLSWTFTVGRNAYRRAFYLAMRSYYGQRCGTAVDLGPEFPGYRHGVCHTAGAFHSSSGRTGEHRALSGWHDAGDYGRYIVNSGITTGTLLWAFELYAPRLRAVKLNLPDERPHIPDMLVEIRWNLEWMRTMQDSDGGVWHKQTSTQFCGFVMPEQDTLPSEVIGTGQAPYKNSCSTADFAAVMAIAGRVYRAYDPAYAEQCLRAAKAAWSWLEKNPAVTFRNPTRVTTGEYGDADCRDEILWAAAELTRTTGGQPYESYFLDHYTSFLSTIRSVGPVSWSNVAPLALWTYALNPKARNTSAVTLIKERSRGAADEIVARGTRHSYRISLTQQDYIWGSNAVAANYSMQLLVANRLSPHQAYVESAMDNLHYLLGRNTFSVSWVTQVGEHAFRNPHHRPSAADQMQLPWPGLLSGGPNPGRQDPVSHKQLAGDIRPAKAWLDDTGAYSVNEVAINWNAPLVFVLAATLE